MTTAELLAQARLSAPYQVRVDGGEVLCFYSLSRAEDFFGRATRRGLNPVWVRKG